MEDGQNLPIAYHEETPKEVINALEFARKNRIRVKLYFGDVKTGIVTGKQIGRAHV